MIRVLVVDDSAFMRKALSMMLGDDPEIEVIDTARDGLEAIAKVMALRPDVVTMDIEMPRMDGITALRRIMQECPTPVMMVSSLTQDGAHATVEALQAGAVDFIPKQHSYVSLEITKIRADLTAKVKSIARSRFHLFQRPRPAPGASSGAAPSAPGTPAPRTGIARPHAAPAPSQPLVDLQTIARLRLPAVRMLVIGVSTGGPFALQQLIPHLPANLPVPVAVVQHMPPHFTKSLADRLDAISPLSVIEAEDGMTVARGHVYIAPGGRHMTFRMTAHGVTIHTPDEPVSLHRPSVDVMFHSANETYRGHLLAVIMTGMGKDGLVSTREIKQQGGRVVAQREETCVVYGMPKVIVEAGLADAVLPLEAIAPTLVRALQHIPAGSPFRPTA